MGGAVVYPHSVSHSRILPSFCAVSRPKFRHLHFPLKEIAYRPLFLRIRADGNRRERPPQINPSPRREGLENAELFDGRSQGSSSKEEILALFKRIQASISKGETLDSKKRSSNNAEAMSSAESVLEVLRQPRTRGKGKALGKRADKFPAPRKDLPKKEQITEQTSAKDEDSKSTRPPSSFSRRSPIPPPLVRQAVQLESEPLPAVSSDSEQHSKKYEDMKLPELKRSCKI